MNVTELIGKRVLAQKAGYYERMDEYKILEISPSKKFIKLMNMNGNKFWHDSSKIIIIETLEDILKNPGK